MIVRRVVARRLSSDPKRCPSCYGTGKDGCDKPCKACEGSGDNSKVVWVQPIVTSYEQPLPQAPPAIKDSKVSQRIG